MNSDTRDGARAVVLAVIMVLSVVAMGVAFTGSAAADSGANISDYTSPDLANFDVAVTTDGSPPETGEFTDEQTYADIQSAIDAEGAETSILVFDGEYSSVDINANGIELVSYNGSTETIISSSNDRAITIPAAEGPYNDIAISGFKISSQSDQGIMVERADGFAQTSSLEISHNNISSGGTNAVQISPELSQLTFVDNVVAAADSGLVISETAAADDGIHSNVKVENNKFTEASTGAASLADIDGLSFANNTIAETVDSFGVALAPAANAVVENNEINIGSGDGVLVTDLGGDLSTVEEVTIRHNSLSGGYELKEGSTAGNEYGVEVDTAISDLYLIDNTISNFRGAISLSKSTQSPTAEGTLVAENTIENVHFGIGQESDTGTQIINNNISAQAQGVSGWNTDDMVVSDNTIQIDNSTISPENVTFAQPRGIDVSGNNVSITGNNITSTHTAVLIQGDTQYTDPAGEDINISHNNFEAAEYGIDAAGYDYVLDATNNWWGSENGPSAGSANTYNDGDQGANVSDNVEFTPWLDAPSPDGETFAPVTNVDTDDQYASIDAALEGADADENIWIKPGSYEESISLDTQNVTLFGEGESSQIVGTVDLNAEETRLSNLSVSPGRFTEDGELDYTAVHVYASNTTVNDVTIEDFNGDGSSTIHGIQVWDDYKDEDRIENIRILHNTIHNLTNDGSGTSAIKVQGAVKRTIVAENTITEIHSDGWSYGIVTTPSENAKVTVEQVGINGNHIDGVTADTYEGTAIGLDTESGDMGDPVKTNANEVQISYNDIQNVDIGVLNRDTENSTSAIFNYWNSSDGPQDVTFVGDVTYDPFLTAPSDEVERPTQEDGVLTRQFASDLTLDEGVNAFAFPAPSERSLNETVNLSNVQAVYAYDNVEESWTQISDDPTPGALDVFVVVVEDGKTAEAVMEFENDRSEQTVPEATEVSGGWNLVSPTQAGANVDEAFATQNADIQTTLSDSPFQSAGSQPLGAGDKPFSPYNAYWTFIDDDEGDSTIAATTYDGITAEEFFVNVDLLTAPENEG